MGKTRTERGHAKSLTTLHNGPKAGSGENKKHRKAGRTAGRRSERVPTIPERQAGGASESQPWPNGRPAKHSKRAAPEIKILSGRGKRGTSCLKEVSTNRHLAFSQNLATLRELSRAHDAADHPHIGGNHAPCVRSLPPYSTPVRFWQPWRVKRRVRLLPVTFRAFRRCPRIEVERFPFCLQVQQTVA